MKKSKPEYWSVCELEVVYRPSKIEPLPELNSREVYRTFMAIWDSNKIAYKEQMYVLYLNNNKQVISWYMLAEGGMDETKIDFRILFGIALRSFSSAIVVAHNHPSGNVIPSEADIMLSKQIKNHAIFHDIRLYDFLVVSPVKYFSFIDQELLHVTK